ncbi:integrase core domain-containing protein [Fusibacter tunisiensis]|uniref:Integrase catalytic domain-containing protein n=1 Tax=Fusibacter tunisiensis TaxID=1008308 RepID=A0ABS2MSM9_9FIRM|nr:hypothetical protein [Fusibacter tunisiensis]
MKNLKKVHPQTIESGEKYKHKLHYLYRKFTVDFFTMPLDSLPKYASSLKFRKQNAYVMSLCLTLHVNLGLSLRKTAQALEDLYGINISHTMVANYCKTAAVLIKPFVEHYQYEKASTFIADGYSAYPLAAQQFALMDEPLVFDITQVIGLANDDAISKEFRPHKQVVERLNRTFKESYRCTCGYDNFDGANYSVALWVAYYNFLRRHSSFGYKPLNAHEMIDNAQNMPGKWQILLYLGQQTVLELSPVFGMPM